MHEFDAADLALLRGETFSASHVLRMARVGAPRERCSLLADLCAGKRVLHIGCADHPDRIERKRREGNYLHEVIARRAAALVGIDINPEGVEAMRRAGFRDIHRADLANGGAPPEVASAGFDLAVLGEILEHLSDPVGFLRTLRREVPGVRSLVVTGPNAFRFANFFAALRTREAVNSDHRAWFTPYTLAKLLADAGFTPTAAGYAMSRRSRFNLPRNALLRLFPAFNEYVVCLAARGPDTP